MLEKSSAIIVVLDIGTGGAHAAAYDLAGNLTASSEASYVTHYDRVQWAEQEPEDWWNATIGALRGMIKQIEEPARIQVIGMTGQSPSVAPFTQDGQPLRRGLIYQDNRATREAEEWVQRFGGREAVHTRTGHDPAAFYIGPKIWWLREHEPEIFHQTVYWMQPRDFVSWRLTGVPATDWSHAGSTLLFDIHQKAWADDLFRLADLDPATFPQAHPSWTTIGTLLPEVARQTGLSTTIPVVIGGADSQCSTVGAGVLDTRMISDMAGTSTCLNAPVRAPLDDLRIANYCHVMPDWWCTELGLNASGAVFSWLATILAPTGGTPLFAECEAAALQSPAGAEGLLFLPYMADGERFNPALRGGFYGLSLRHQRGELARAVLEGVAFAIREQLAIMAEAGAPVSEIHVSGGGARVDLWNQIKADVTGLPVVSVVSNATSLGVAIVAGTVVKLYASLEEAVAHSVKVSRRYEPDPAHITLYDDLYERFRLLERTTSAIANAQTEQKG